MSLQSLLALLCNVVEAVVKIKVTANYVLRMWLAVTGYYNQNDDNDESAREVSTIEKINN